MQYKTLSLLFLSATALAAPGPQKTDSLEENPEYEEYLSSVGALASQTGFGDIASPTDVELPSSVLAVLMTAMPASFINQLADPSAISSLDKDWKTGKAPEWYSKLPDDVQDYISSQLVEYDDATTTDSARETGSSTGRDTTAGSASATATGTSDSSSSAAQTSDAQTTGAKTTASSSASGSSAAETTGSQGATSEGGAPAPTGAMAASLAGAAGILGLAIAL